MVWTPIGYLLVASMATMVVSGEDLCMFMPPSTCRLGTAAVNAQLGLNATRFECTVPPSIAFMAAEEKVNMGMGNDPNMGWACDANRTAMGCANVTVLHQMTMSDGTPMTHNMAVCMPASFAANATAAQTWFDAMDSYATCMMGNPGMSGNTTMGNSTMDGGGMSNDTMHNSDGMDGSSMSDSALVSTATGDGGDEMTAGLTMEGPDMGGGPCGAQIGDVMKAGWEIEDGVSADSADKIASYMSQAASICGAATNQIGCTAASATVSKLATPTVVTVAQSAVPSPPGTSGAPPLLRGLTIVVAFTALVAGVF